MFKLKHISIMFAIAVLPAFAQANPQSDTVPSSTLEATFVVMSSDTPNKVQANVKLAQATVVDGVEHDVPLIQSDDDVVIFSVGSTSIVYDPGNTSPIGNLLPMMPGETYHVTFKRFNGEVFNSTIKYPSPIAFMKPAPNTIFKKSEPVNVAWQPVQAEIAQIWIEWWGCHDTTGYADWDSETSYVFPAGYTERCPGVIPFNFILVEANPGDGYGLTYAIEIQSIPFSYGDGEEKARSTSLSRHDMIERLLASKFKNHDVITVKH